VIEEDCDGSDDDDSSFEDVNQFLRNNLNDISHLTGTGYTNTSLHVKSGSKKLIDEN
jgi:hypothetical protein